MNNEQTSSFSSRKRRANVESEVDDSRLPALRDPRHHRGRGAAGPCDPRNRPRPLSYGVSITFLQVCEMLWRIRADSSYFEL